MKKIIILLITAFCFSHLLIAQDYVNKDYTWAKEIPKYTLSEEDKKFGEICIEEKKSIEIVVTDEGAFQYYLWHNIKLVNTSDAIERNNTVRIPYSGKTEVLINKLRVIQPDGKIIEMTEEDIKEAEDEKEKKKYKYFAVRGLVVGAIIERIVLRKMEPQLTGVTYNMQADYPSKWQIFELIYPYNLKFETKTYNMDNKEFSMDTSDDKKMRKYVQLENVNALNDEKYSNFEASLKAVSYKMTGNYSTGKMNLFSFKEIVDNVYPVLNPELTKDDIKTIEKFLSKSNVSSATDELDKIKKIESYVKSNVVCGEDVRVENRDLSNIVKTKVTDFFGMTKLFCCIFNHLGIKHQEVFTTNRYEELFDPKFENQNHLDKYMIYFPGNKYLAPTDMLSRYPFVPYQYTNNYGLFMKPVELGGVKIGVAEKRKIDYLDYTYSLDTMDIDIDLNKDIAKPTINYRISWYGYIADRIQPFMQLVEEKEKDKIRKDVIEGFAGDMTNVTVTTENEGVDFYGNKPFIAKCATNNQNIVEKVGDTYLFKLGEVIGRQEEMYQQGERQTDISVPYTHIYARNIQVKIPEGYTLKNLDKINFTKICKLDDKIAAQFITSYTYENNMLIIHNEESYRLLDLPMNKYDEFKNVINAAADFNKVVLILEPK